MRFYLVPVNGTAVICNILVVVTMFNREVDGFLKGNRIHNMETVCWDPSQRIIFQNQPVVWACILSLVEIPPAREIIFGSRTMDRWLFLSIHKYFFISFKETECMVIRLYAHINTNNMPMAFGVQNGKVWIVISTNIPVPVCMKVPYIRTDRIFKLLVIDLVIKPFQLLPWFVYDNDPGQVFKRHRKKTGISARRHPKVRGNILPVSKSTSEEITQRNFYWRIILIVPIHLQ